MAPIQGHFGKGFGSARDDLGAANESRSPWVKNVLFSQVPGDASESKIHTQFAKISERSEANYAQIGLTAEKVAAFLQ